MLVKYIFTVLFIISNTAISFGQLKIIDSVSGLPIASVNIFSEYGDLIGISDTSGFVNNVLFLNNEKNNEKKLSFQHISYNNLETTVKNANQIGFIKLIPKTILLDEIIFSEKKAPNYILTAYFRSYQAYNSHAQYFCDGIVQFYTSKNSTEIKKRVIEYRIFENKNLAPELKSNVLNEPPRTISIGDREAISELNKDYSIIASGTGKEIYKQNFKVGYIKQDTDNGIVALYLNKLAPHKIIAKKILWIDFNITKNEVIENYRSNDMNRLNKEDLESMYINYLISYRTKKKKDFTELQFIGELYVINHESTTEEIYKKVKNSSIFLGEKSSILTNYWDKLHEWNVPQINNQIKLELDKTLILK